MIVFFSTLITIVICTLLGYSLWYDSPKHKGKMGEEKIFNTLMQLPDEYFVMNDVVLNSDNGTSQIDHVVVSKYGIFAIETKNYRGDIYGDDNRKDWTQIIVTEVTYERKWWKTYTYVTKNHLYNPVKQSLGHCYAIRKYLNKWPHLKVIPIVVFTDKANLKFITSKHHVIYDSQLLSVIMSYKTIYIRDEEVRDVAEWLCSVDVRVFVEDKDHIKNIKLAKKRLSQQVTSGICPKCGGTLVCRSGRFGTFYGCSNYPQCKFTVKK